MTDTVVAQAAPQTDVQVLETRLQVLAEALALAISDGNKARLEAQEHAQRATELSEELAEARHDLAEAQHDYRMAKEQVRASGRYERFEVKYVENQTAAEVAALLNAGWRVAYETLAFDPTGGRLHFLRLEREAQPEPAAAQQVGVSVMADTILPVEDTEPLTLQALDAILYQQVGEPVVAQPEAVPSAEPVMASTTAMLTADFVMDERIRPSRRLKPSAGQRLDEIIEGLPLARHIRDHGKEDALDIMNAQVAQVMRTAYEDAVAKNAAFVPVFPALGEGVRHE